MAYNKQRKCTYRLPLLLVSLCNRPAVVTAFFGRHNHPHRATKSSKYSSSRTIGVRRKLPNFNAHERIFFLAKGKPNLSSSLFYNNYDKDIEGITQIKLLQANDRTDFTPMHSSILSSEEFSMEELLRNYSISPHWMKEQLSIHSSDLSLENFAMEDLLKTYAISPHLLMNEYDHIL